MALATDGALKISAHEDPTPNSFRDILITLSYEQKPSPSFCQVVSPTCTNHASPFGAWQSALKLVEPLLAGTTARAVDSSFLDRYSPSFRDPSTLYTSNVKMTASEETIRHLEIPIVGILSSTAARFACSPRLPTEVRLSIRHFALPGPRITRLHRQCTAEYI